MMRQRQTPLAAGQGSVRALSRGAVLIIAFEFFERFGFYSMLSLLALLLTAERAGGGFGWAAGPALTLVGAFTGLMYALPVLGGWLADRLLGHRRAIALGGATMLVGYLLMTAPFTAPPLLEALIGGGLAERFAAVAAPLGGWSAPEGSDPPLTLAYLVVTFSFWLAIGALIIGNALMKATLVVVLGDSFAGDHARRESAYAYYYMGINLGGLAAGVVAGSVAASFGWGAALGISAVGMAIAVLAFFLLQRRLLGEERARRTANGSVHAPDENGLGLRVVLLVIFAALLLVYSVGAFQLWGAMSLFIESGVDRHIGAFEIPTQWFVSVNAGALILSAPLFAAIWARLDRTGRAPDAVGKYALALGLGAAGLLLFAWSAWPRASAGLSGWATPAVAIAIQAMGEVAAWTSTYGLVYRLAPRRAVAAAMGAYYAATLGLGGYIGGWLGQFATPIGVGRYFLLLALFTLAAAALALMARPALRRLAARAGGSLDP